MSYPEYSEAYEEWLSSNLDELEDLFFEHKDFEVYDCDSDEEYDTIAREFLTKHDAEFDQWCQSRYEDFCTGEAQW